MTSVLRNMGNATECYAYNVVPIVKSIKLRVLKQLLDKIHNFLVNYLCYKIMVNIDKDCKRTKDSFVQESLQNTYSGLILMSSNVKI